MRRAQFSRHAQPLGDDVDGDDRRAADDPRRDDGGEADCADAKDRDRGPGLRPKHVHDRSHPGLDAASERRKKLQRQIGIDLDDVPGSGDRMGCEGRLCEEMPAQLAPATPQRRAAWPVSEQIDGTKLIAIAERAVAAIRTLTA